MKRPAHRGVVPPGGLCRYTDPDAAFTVAHPYYTRCRDLAKAGRISRSLPIPYDWEAFFDEQLCRATPQACIEVPDAPIETGPSWIALAAQFATSMTRWITRGFPVTPWDEFKQRYAQCAGDGAGTPRCPHFGRFASTGIARCGKCGCSSLKLFLKTEHCPIKKW